MWGGPTPPPPNLAWWTFQVIATKVEEMAERGKDTATEKFYGFRDKEKKLKWFKMSLLTLSGRPDDAAAKFLKKRLTSFFEMRQTYFSYQPQSWITYHSWMILEVAGGEHFISLEKKSTKLEIMMGDGQVARTTMKDFRPTGSIRDLRKCKEQEAQKINGSITVAQLFDWIDGTLAEHWRPYDMWRSNCQMFTSDLEDFLLDPESTRPLSIKTDDREEAIEVVRKDARALLTAPESLQQDKDFVKEVLSPNWTALRYTSDRFRKDPEVVLAALAWNGYAMQYAAESLRASKDFMMKAVKIDGHALCYASEEMRRDKQLVLAAIYQNGYALQYAAKELRTDRDFVLEASTVNGHVLAVCDKDLRADREVLLAAVKQNGYAVQYAGEDRKTDFELIKAAGWQNPRALKLICC